MIDNRFVKVKTTRMFIDDKYTVNNKLIFCEVISIAKYL